MDAFSLAISISLQYGVPLETEIPGLGWLPVNAFVLHGREPVVVDTGLALRAGQLLWATVDSPWVHGVDQKSYLRNVRAMQSIGADVTLSSHLPPAHDLSAELSDMLAAAPYADPFVGPDQRALEQMLASFEPGSAPS